MPHGTQTSNVGRLCNQIIRNLAVSLIAEKYDLHVDYYNYNLIKDLGIELFVGNKIHQNTIKLDDNNYFSVYNAGHLNSNLDPIYDFFQTREITTHLYDYLHTDKVKLNIMEKNPFKCRYNNNNDAYVHIRLTDAEQWNPGIAYYVNVINSISFNTLYISSDDINHYIVQTIIKMYPNSNLITYDEIKTIQFASTCKHIILSHGSFSAIIGYLSFYSTVNYAAYDHPGRVDVSKKIWYGDMFSINGWVNHGTLIAKQL
jgi:hypothetical protein